MRWELWEVERPGIEDIAVAWSDTEREIQHYALVYGQDGPVEIRDTQRHPIQPGPYLERNSNDR